MERLEYFLNPADTDVVVVRFPSRRTALVAIDTEAVYLLGVSPTREEADHAGKRLHDGKLSIYDCHGIFPLTRIRCMSYTVVVTD